MQPNSYTSTFTVDRSSLEVFFAINDVRSWWTGEIEGSFSAVGDVFSYRFEDLHRSTQRVTSLIPGELVVWHVDDAHLSFVADGAEWTGTDIRFVISPSADGTTVTLTHEGLTPAVECFEACSGGWNLYFGQGLRQFIETA